MNDDVSSVLWIVIFSFIFLVLGVILGFIFARSSRIKKGDQ